jgi:hypothetical protein
MRGRLLPHFIQAGAESPSRGAIIVTELPLPNRTTLQVCMPLQTPNSL